MNESFDVAIVGSGPAALTAAIYTAREGLATVVLEKGAVGGLLATISKIDNYPGYENISGIELAEKFAAQAERFGAVIKTAEVMKIDRNDTIEVTTDEGKVNARAVVIASGSAYKKLGIPGEENAHYCATCDGPFYRDKNLVVIGGANSAVQEAIFLAKYAKHVDLVARGKFSASQKLMDELGKNGRITSHTGLAAKEIITNDGVVTAVDFGEKTLPCDGVFIFAGQTPATEFLPASRIELDENGYVKTDDGMMTNLGGVFAAGDVRSGVVRQVAVAVGEGAAVARRVRDYIGGGK